MRLQRYIAESGFCSRRKAEDLIKKGKVIQGNKIAEIGDEYDGKRVIVEGAIIKPQKKVYLMLNKPIGFITTTSDPYGRASVLQLLHIPERVFPVGRLDKDTSGLLLLTNDGDWANRIAHPRHQVKKTYVATLNKKFQDADLASMNSGVELDGKKVEVRARRLSSKKVQVTIHTGLNKEVKRLFKNFGYWVKDLYRVRIGSLKVDVKPGKYRHLVPSEIEKFN